MYFIYKLIGRLLYGSNFEKYEKQNSNNHFISHKTYLDIIRATNA